jgi:lipopolysaccharide export system permease protein
LFIYQKYILKKLVAVFLLTVVFFTAILFIFNIFRIARHVAAGLQISLAAKLFLYLVPSLLGFSIPFGALVACLLVYGRLSAQNEILALRANGVSLYRTASSAAILAVGTFLLAALVFGVVSPKGRYAVRKLKKELGSVNPVFLFEPGRTINAFPGFSIYLGRKSGNRLHKIVIHSVDKQGVTTRIDAETGTVQHYPQTGKISLKLQNVKVIMSQKGQPHVWDERDKSMEIKFDLASAMEKITVPKREDDMTFRELLARARITKENGEDPFLYETELNKRLVLSIACISFAIMGTPLGIRVHRGEKAVGVSIGLGLAMSFYTVVMLAERLRDKPGVHPQLLMWLPNVILIALGLLFFRRVHRGRG